MQGVLAFRLGIRVRAAELKCRLRIKRGSTSCGGKSAIHWRFTPSKS
jgi:hypothetical protein